MKILSGNTMTLISKNGKDDVDEDDFDMSNTALCRISTKSEHRANFGGSKIDFEKWASTLV